MYSDSQDRGHIYQFSLIVRLVILRNLWNDDWLTVAMDTGVWLEEDERKRRRLASGFPYYFEGTRWLDEASRHEGGKIGRLVHTVLSVIEAHATQNGDIALCKW